MRNALRLVSALLLAVGLAGCSGITEADREFARELMAQSGSNCVHIEGGTAMGTLPMLGGVTAGGYRGSLSAAHSEGDKSLSCGAVAAEVK